ncbi:MAG: methyltransferase domain-containing protein [Proteobacteria bacterium]|nr:methyltransferase domain-containing protein [Pseudomonadota bacterium]MBU4296115.1 methyltransferase domain-containing protein [Pseudomonadota bacterium]MCG2746736.1 methyltransferase domain-containing protein [Desulfobulbaceae bacterium]
MAGLDQAPAARAGQGHLSAPDEQRIREAIRAKYVEVARSPAGRFLYPIGREGAEKLGYDQAIIDRAPVQLLQSFCGVGNPFSLGGIALAHRVLDFGCGAGFDMFVAGNSVGPGGLVCGIDLTEDMVVRATDNLRQAGMTNFEIRQVDREDIPFASNFFDVVISNGAINLSPNKQRCFAEIFRVLKPCGKLHFADVILEKDLPSHLIGSLEAWSQ